MWTSDMDFFFPYSPPSVSEVEGFLLNQFQEKKKVVFLQNHLVVHVI